MSLRSAFALYICSVSSFTLQVLGSSEVAKVVSQANRQELCCHLTMNLMGRLDGGTACEFSAWQSTNRCRWRIQCVRAIGLGHAQMADQNILARSFCNKHPISSFRLQAGTS